MAKKFEQGGAYLKGLRENIGLKQRSVAELLDLPYYTILAQIEAGNTKLPPSLWERMAKILGVDPAEFSANLTTFYES